MRRALGSLSLLLGASIAVVGCGDTPDTDDPPPERVDAPGGDGLSVKFRGPPDATIELQEFEHEWEDLDLDDQGRRDAEQVALWRTERHNAVLTCLNHEPPARGQAKELLKTILENVPTSSKDRVLLGQCYFAEAAYWFFQADRIAWEVERVQSQKTVITDEEVHELEDDEVEELVTQYRAWLERANQLTRDHAQKSLREYNRYRVVRPDDRTAIDVIWKLHFYLQNYDEAQRWLAYELQEFDNAEVPRNEPLRVEYEAIYEEISNYLAEIHLSGEGDAPAPPRAGSSWRDDRRRRMYERMGGLDRR